MSSKSIASRLILKNPCLALLESCTSMVELKQIQAHMYRTGLWHDDEASANLFEKFCGICNSPDLHYARQLFDLISQPRTYTWNTLIRAHCSKSRNNPSAASIAACLYKEMLQRGGAKPNGITFSFVSKACPDESFLRMIHAHALQFGFYSDVYVLNSLICGYSTSGCVDTARRIFNLLSDRDLVSWTVVIQGYVRSNRAREAIDLFFSMREEERDQRMDEVTAVSIFTACAQLGDLSLARRIECLVRDSGVELNAYMSNALIDMYSKCGSIEDARKRFDEMVDKNLVSWNSMVSGYGRAGDMDTANRLFEQIPKTNDVSWSALLNGYLQNGNSKEALAVFHEMKAKGLSPNDASIVGAITACAHLGALESGQEIHRSLNEERVTSDVVLATALVDMYVKCGCLEIARELFNRISRRNVVSYNVMISGLAVHGKASACFEVFAEMLKSRSKPDSVTFLGILSACAHAGWLEDGKKYFNQMTAIYGITPRIEHRSCMVHLMGRNGELFEAYDFIKASLLEPDVIIWGALLNACKIYGNVELGESVARKILELDPRHGGALVLLSSLNASAKRWDEVSRIRKKINEMEVVSRPGRSWIELDGRVHEFCVGDSLHPEMKEISSLLGLIDI